MKLELAILAGAESKKFLLDFTEQITRLEKLTEKLGNLKADALEADGDDDEDDIAPPKKAPKKKAASLDDDDEEAAEDVASDDDEADEEGSGSALDDDDDDSDDAEEDEEDESDGDDDEDEEDEPPKKKGKPKKLTNDDCNDAAKALAKAIGGPAGRKEVYKLMKKHFETDSVAELKPDQYPKFVEVMTKALAKVKKG